jgi:hypothetical protein
MCERVGGTWDKVVRVETQDHSANGVTCMQRGIVLDTTSWCTFIPLSDFEPDWEYDSLGERIRLYAPQAFGGQPAPVAPLSPGERDHLFSRRVPTIVLIAAINATLILGCVVYAAIVRLHPG